MKKLRTAQGGKRIFALFWMILFDLILHLGETFKIEQLYKWLTFPTRFQYSIFWTVYWGIAFILILSLVVEKFRNR